MKAIRLLARLELFLNCFYFHFWNSFDRIGYGEQISALDTIEIDKVFFVYCDLLFDMTFPLEWFTSYG